MKKIPWLEYRERFDRWWSERLAGWFDIAEWPWLIMRAFTIQLSVHFIAVILYLLHLNKRLPFTASFLGTPYALGDYAAPFLAALALSPIAKELFLSLVYAPVVEELRYRGLVWSSVVFFDAKWIRWGTVIVAATLWAFLHGRALLGTSEIVVGGILSGWLVLRTKNVIPSIIFHALWNAVVMLTLFLGIV